jgi:hypothetical protein
MELQGYSSKQAKRISYLTQVAGYEKEDKNEV